MIKEERYDIILKLLSNEKYYTPEFISHKSKIPLTTLRRDIVSLENKNKIIKVHGGIKLLSDKNEVIEKNYWKKIEENSSAKKTVAKIALDKIIKGSTIFLDSGSSCFYLSKLITNDLDLRIYTNSIVNAQELLKNDIANVHIIPGIIKKNTLAISSAETLKYLEKYNFEISFLGTNAIDGELNNYTTNFDEAEVKKLIIKKSDKIYCLADTTKLNSKSLIQFSKKDEMILILERENI